MDNHTKAKVAFSDALIREMWAKGLITDAEQKKISEYSVEKIKDLVAERGGSMARGKSINIFLMDGDASGRVKATIANWTGIAYKIPRTSIDICKDRADLKQSGVYFLFGVEEHTGKQVAYIGQAGARKNGEGILNRLMEHKRNPEKDYWTEAVVFTTQNNSLGPTEISYLENRFCNIALSAERYVIKNGNDPTQGNISEEKLCEMEEFIDYAELTMGVLGHKVFEPLFNVAEAGSQNATDDRAMLYYETSSVKASGCRTSDGFVIIKGSRISSTVHKSCPNYIKKLRSQYADKIGEDSILTGDILVSSPTTAAGFVSASSVNGNIAWKNYDGVTLKEMDEK